MSLGGKRETNFTVVGYVASVFHPFFAFSARLVVSVGPDVSFERSRSNLVLWSSLQSLIANSELTDVNLAISLVVSSRISPVADLP